MYERDVPLETFKVFVLKPFGYTLTLIVLIPQFVELGDTCTLSPRRIHLGPSNFNIPLEELMLMV
tara:strand:- start:1029 stop:1223 length:195 start_codon:yes stop_codon:yes gene_type:complete